MSSRYGTIAVFLVIAGFVGGSIYVIATQGNRLLLPEARKEAPAPPAPVAPSEPRQAVSEPASPSPVRPSMELEAAQRVRSGVYRCVEDGTVIYADQPCANGREVDARKQRTKAR